MFAKQNRTLHVCVFHLIFQLTKKLLKKFQLEYPR